MDKPKSIYKTQVGRSVKKLFFMNGKLYRILHVYRAGNLVYAWDFDGHQKVTFLHSDVRKLSNRAYSTPEVSEMLGVHRQTINSAIRSGEIREPPRPYAFATKQGEWANAPHVWSKDAILDLHEYLISKRWGGRQSEFFPSNRSIPNRLELLTMLEQGTVTYIKTKDGEFIPAWKAPEW